MIEAVLFDIDGTLLDHDAASSASLRAALDAEHEGLDGLAHTDALAEWRRLEELHYDVYLSGSIDLAEQRRRRAAGILEWLGAEGREDPELDLWFERFIDGYRERWRAFDDAVAAIDALERASIALGVITNADGAIQRRKLAALGLESRLPAFVASSEAGSAKPEAAIFRAACELVELPAERVAYVGDRLDTDARGARDAGLLGIWLDRVGEAERLAARGGDPGVAVIESLEGLGAALRIGS